MESRGELAPVDEGMSFSSLVAPSAVPFEPGTYSNVARIRCCEQCGSTEQQALYAHARLDDAVSQGAVHCL